VGKIVKGIDPIVSGSIHRPHICHDESFVNWRYADFPDFYKIPDTLFFKKTGEFVSYFELNRQLFIGEHSIHNLSTWNKVAIYFFREGKKFDYLQSDYWQPKMN